MMPVNFNPSHDRLGRFASKSGNSHVTEKMPENVVKFFPENTSDATNGMIIARFEANKELRKKGYTSDYRGKYNGAIDVDGTKDALYLATTKYASTIEKETIMYRGIDNKFAKKLTNGKVVVDRGHTFVTTNKVMAQKYAKKKGTIVEVKVPKGQKGFWGFKDQNEFIFPRDTRFKITNDKNGISMEVI